MNNPNIIYGLFYMLVAHIFVDILIAIDFDGSAIILIFLIPAFIFFVLGFYYAFKK